jgi:hypothetical protein
VVLMLMVRLPAGILQSPVYNTILAVYFERYL